MNWYVFILTMTHAHNGNIIARIMLTVHNDFHFYAYASMGCNPMRN
jgi:hypothetical protein